MSNPEALDRRHCRLRLLTRNRDLLAGGRERHHEFLLVPSTLQVKLALVVESAIAVALEDVAFLDGFNYVASPQPALKASVDGWDIHNQQSAGRAETRSISVIAIVSIP